MVVKDEVQTINDMRVRLLVTSLRSSLLSPVQGGIVQVT